LTKFRRFGIIPQKTKPRRWVMERIVGTCPACGAQMAVKRLQCPECGTSIEGNFDLGRLYRLTPEQMQFIELFLQCEGKLNKVQKILNVSYPTAKARLLDALRAMGYEVKKEPAVLRKRRKAAPTP
jgi:hypothetical protein